MDSEPYKKREIDHMFDDIKSDLALIIEQTTRHNGRLTKVERGLLVVGCICGTVLVLRFPEILNIIKLLL